jgi:hypothetical protein
MFAVVFSPLLIAATASPIHRHQAHKANAAAEENRASPSPISTPSYQPGSKPTPKETENDTYNYYYPASKPESPSVWFQKLTTIILLVFTGGLWWSSYRQWLAIGEQVNIAKRTLEREKIPLVFVGQAKRPVFLSGVGNNRSATVEYTFKNYGNGPAFLYSMAVNCDAREHFGPVKLVAPISPTFSSGNVLPVGEETDLLRASYKIECDEGEWRNFIQEPTSQQKLFLYGEIAYTDIWEDKWVTGFAWVFDIMKQRMRIATEQETPGYNLPPRKKEQEKKDAPPKGLLTKLWRFRAK